MARARDGDSHFTDAAVAEADDEAASASSRETKAYVAPGDFLRMAMGGRCEEKAGRAARNHAGNGGAFTSVPRLLFENVGDGTARVVGHEGRHRSAFLQAHGVGEMPVRLRCVGGPGGAVRWGLRGTPRDAVARHPTVLVSEDGLRTMPMPDSAVFPRADGDAEEAPPGPRP